MRWRSARVHKPPASGRAPGVSHGLTAFMAIWLFTPVVLFAQYEYSVNVQVVDLQVSVMDRDSNYVRHLQAEDFLVTEDGISQEVLDLDLERQPFSIGILLDTSGSMESAWRITARAVEDFISAMRPEDEFFIMLFDDDLKMKEELRLATNRSYKLEGIRYGIRTRLFDAIITSVEKLSTARYPRRALFVVSDGINTWGPGDEKKARELAQKNKTLIYSLALNADNDWFNPLKTLATATGATCFVMKEQFPRMHVAYEKIASDLAHRVTLYYRSRSDYTGNEKPRIEVRMKNPDWRVQYQKAYYPQ